MLLTHALALSADQFLCKQKSLRVCALGGNWTREIDFSRHEDNLPSHRGRRLVYLTKYISLLSTIKYLSISLYFQNIRINNTKQSIQIFCVYFYLMWRQQQQQLHLPSNQQIILLLRILCDTLTRWLEAVSSTLVEMVTRARKLPGRQEVLPCCGEDVVDIEHWRLGGQHTHR